MRFNWIVIFILISIFSEAQSLYTKCFIKKNEILVRWVPGSKELFDLAVKNGYKITRSVLVNGQLTEGIVLSESFKPYSKEDPRWTELIKENKNAILIIQALYENQNNKNIPAKEKTQQDNMLFGLVLLSCDFDSELAKATGLFFKDSLISNSKTYSYKIEINLVPENVKYAPGTLIADASKLSSNPKIENLKAKFKNRNVKLKWEISKFSDYYGGYNVERSSDSTNYSKINKAPVILLTSQFEKSKTEIIYNDTTPLIKTKYFYRIRGVNNFGELSEPSNIVSGIGYQELNSYLNIDSLKIIGHQKVFLQWRLERKEENKNVKEYIVWRAEKDIGQYEPIFKSTPDKFNFTDEKPNSSNYYKLAAVTFGNDTIVSFSRLALIADTIAPLAPRELKATVDSKGNVSIKWLPNSEKDLQGYKLFKANSLKEEFVQISNTFITNTEYKDKLNLNTLSKTIYYALVATDNNYNNSVLSVPVEVKRPDTIAPVAAIIKNLQLVSNGIKITIIKSSSDDVKNYVLYRKENNKEDVKIKEWNNTDTLKSFTDTTAELGLGYYYKIIVSDEDDNISLSNSPYIKYETGFRKKITGVVFEVNRSAKFINLKWNYSEKGVEKYIIYRSSKKEPLTVIKTLLHPQQNYTDKTPNMGNNYEYRIKAVYTNGAESIISDAVLVEY